MRGTCFVCGLHTVHGYVETASVIAVLNYADQTSDDIVGHSMYRTQFKVRGLVAKRLGRWTFDQEIVGSTRGRGAISWLLLRWVTV